MEVLNRALWSRKTTLKLCNSGTFSTLTVEKANDARAGTDVETVIMDELIAAHPINELFIVKIDIEGVENMVLAHNSGWLKQKPMLVVEPHDDEIRHNASLAGLLGVPAYQTAEIVVKGSTLIFVPERTIPVGYTSIDVIRILYRHMSFDRLMCPAFFLFDNGNMMSHGAFSLLASSHSGRFCGPCLSANPFSFSDCEKYDVSP